MAVTDNVLTPEFRVSFPDVFKPNTYGNKESFQITMLIPKEDTAFINVLKGMVAEAIKEEWPDKAKRPELNLPFADGDKKSYEGYAGHIAVRVSSKYRPGVVNARREDIIDESEMYGGCFARAQINAYTWEFGGKHGVSFGLQNVQKLRDGDHFGNRVRADEAFDDGYVPPEGFDDDSGDAGDNIFNDDEMDMGI